MRRCVIYTDYRLVNIKGQTESYEYYDVYLAVKDVRDALEYVMTRVPGIRIASVEVTHQIHVP